MKLGPGVLHDISTPSKAKCANFDSFNQVYRCRICFFEVQVHLVAIPCPHYKNKTKRANWPVIVEAKDDRPWFSSMKNTETDFPWKHKHPNNSRWTQTMVGKKQKDEGCNSVLNYRITFGIYHARFGCTRPSHRTK